MASGGGDQLQDFLRFFASKHDVYATEIGGVFEDVKGTELRDDMFTREDVEAIIGSLLRATRRSMATYADRMRKMSALIVEQLLNGARAANVTIAFDMTKIEDASELARIGRPHPLTSLREEDLKRKAGTVKLDSIRDEHARLVSSSGKLTETNEMLKNKVTQVQSAYASAMKEKATLNDRVRDLERQVAMLSATSTAEDTAASEKVGLLTAEKRRLSESLADARREIAGLHEEIDVMKDKASRAPSAPSSSKVEDEPAPSGSGSVKVTDSKQYKQLKALLQRKNQQLTETRRRLQKYEPDDAGYVDDSGPRGK